MKDIRWKEGYAADLSYKFDKNGNLYKKNNASAKRQHRCDDGLDNMIREYAKQSPIIKAWCGEDEFKAMVKKSKSNRRLPNQKALKEARELLNR